MFRTVWLENPAVACAEDVPDIGLAAHDATHLAGADEACADVDDADEDDADAGMSATAPRASAIPPTTAASRRVPVVTDDNDFTP
jgi:hypothetical protein